MDGWMDNQYGYQFESAAIGTSHLWGLCLSLYLCKAQFDASLLKGFGKLFQFLQITGLVLLRYWHVFGHLQMRHVHVVLHGRSCQTRATHSLDQTNFTEKEIQKMMRMIMMMRLFSFYYIPKYVDWRFGFTCGVRASPGWCWRRLAWLWLGRESRFCWRTAIKIIKASINVFAFLKQESFVLTFPWRGKNGWMEEIVTSLEVLKY